MKITIYNTAYRDSDSIANFVEFYYSLRMPYLASDFLAKGLSPNQIIKAVAKAIKVAESSGIHINHHFKPVFSSFNHEIINDCKLSKLGYGLVLMNADEAVLAVGKFQVNILKEVFHM